MGRRGREPGPAWRPASGDGVLRDSWRRSWGVHGDPAEVREVPVVAESQLDDTLLHHLAAPLDAQSRGLAGTGVALLLTDSAGRVLHTWCPDPSARRHLAAKGTVRGADLSESSVGTNGVGTVISSGRPVQVRGGQHFASFYADAICTGEPVHHPVTGSLLGAVTLSCELTPRADLLCAWVRAIRLHLLSCLPADSSLPAAACLPAPAPPLARGAGDGEDFTLAAQERRAVQTALSQAGGNVTAAAALLGVSRATLYRRLARDRRRAAASQVETVESLPQRSPVPSLLQESSRWQEAR